jgi:hypothetical protein
MALRPPILMKNFDRNRAVTGRERLAHLDMFFSGAVDPKAVDSREP